MFDRLRQHLNEIFACSALVCAAASMHAAEPFYGVGMIDARALWPVTTGRAIRVAIIDTGIDATHPLLASAYRGGFDFVHNDGDPDEETAEAHGTFVAGVVLQVAPDAEIYSLKIFAKADSFATSDLVRAIDWAISHHIDVINMSFALKQQLDDARRALDRAEAAGIVVVAAAGNNARHVEPSQFHSNYLSQWCFLVSACRLFLQQPIRCGIFTAAQESR
jgi:subtilisin family serine protease